MLRPTLSPTRARWVQDESLSRSSLLFEHDLFRKPVSTFLDHALDPEYREPQDQEHQEDHDEDVEQEARDVGGGGRYAGETENAGDDRDHEEEQRPFQKCHSFYSSLRAAAPDEFPPLTSDDATGSPPFCAPAGNWTLLNHLPGGNIRTG